jgi:hypothetical protein
MSYRAQMTIPPQLEPYSRTIRLELGFDLHYYDAGSPAAPVLVLIHGLGDEADTWRHVLPLLAETHRVLALDLPGFGRSAHPWRAYSLLFFARVVGAFLEQLGISKATLVGSSLGAAVASVSRLAALLRSSNWCWSVGGCRSNPAFRLRNSGGFLRLALGKQPIPACAVHRKKPMPRCAPTTPTSMPCRQKTRPFCARGSGHGSGALVSDGPFSRHYAG